MKKVAVLLDGGLVLRALHRLLGERHPTAGDVWAFAQACVRGDEELFRIHFYDCPPYEGRRQNPVSREMVNFSESRTARRKRKLHQQLALMDYVAMREGELSFNGWILSRQTTDELIEEQRPIRPEDLKPDLEQKRVDLEIGLDVAWLASKRIVDRIILATSDSDFVPALAFARREGIQVVVVTMGYGTKQALRKNADEIRDVDFPPKQPLLDGCSTQSPTAQSPQTDTSVTAAGSPEPPAVTSAC